MEISGKLGITSLFVLGSCLCLHWFMHLDGPNKQMDFTLCEVTFGKVDTCHCQCALASALLIPSHASTAQLVQISEY
jgi:hypothetical protein